MTIYVVWHILYCCSFELLLDMTLLWRHNGCDGVSLHQPHECLLNRSSRCRSKKTLRIRVTGLCAGNSPQTGEFPAQMSSWMVSHRIRSEFFTRNYLIMYSMSTSKYGYLKFTFLKDKIYSTYVAYIMPMDGFSTKQYDRDENKWLHILFNPVRAKFFRGNINTYLHFVSFLHIDTTQVGEILP